MMCCYCALNLYMSIYKNLGYGKILGLRRDKDKEKRSLEARADAFSRLKRCVIIRDRIRTCNLSVRSRTRYPLRHTDQIFICTFLYI